MACWHGDMDLEVHRVAHINILMYPAWMLWGCILD
jgi:hypothetical protein